MKLACDRRDALDRMRKAFTAGNIDEVLMIARKLCGVDDEQEGDRVNPRLH